jgi:hypothetical protein
MTVSKSYLLFALLALLMAVLGVFCALEPAPFKPIKSGDILLLHYPLYSTR